MILFLILSVAYIIVFEWILDISFWWLWMPPMLASVLYVEHYKYVWSVWHNNVDWVLLKIQVPKEVENSPKGMDQFFAQLHGILWGSGNAYQRIMEGKYKEWATLEIESNGGIVNFYIRVRRMFDEGVKSALYAQFPDIKVVEADDYMKEIPDDIPNDQYDLFGCDFSLIKPDAYPIRTYIDFKDELTSVNTKRGAGGLLQASGSWVDPMAALIEAMSSIRPVDRAFVHISVRPEGSGNENSWEVKARKVRDELIERLEAKKKGNLQMTAEDAGAMGKNIAGELGSILTMGSGIESTFPDHAPKPTETRLQRNDVTQGEEETITALERSLDKLGFKIEFRACAIDKREPRGKPLFPAIYGAVMQFNSYNLNGFDFRLDAGTKMGDYNFLSNFRLNMRKSSLLNKFKTREFPPHDDDNRSLGILTTEELATMFHFPATFVQTPQVDRAEVRRGAPPLDLPIVE